MTGNNTKWAWEIHPTSGWFDFRLKELWLYKDLIARFVKRDFLAIYKQTILGPIWIFLQPLLTTLMFIVIFSEVAKISTEGVPPLLFYMAGIIGWNYFSECFTITANTFMSNANVFSQVYFPRLTIPISVVISQLIRFLIQFALFAAILIYFYFNNSNIRPNAVVLLIPLIILMMAGLGLGCGLVISSLTAKYRDLNNLITFGVRLLMYATPVIYPISIVPEKFKLLVWLNPMSPLIESFRYAFLGSGTFDPKHLLYSLILVVCVLLLGIALFNKMEETVMDIV